MPQLKISLPAGRCDGQRLLLVNPPPLDGWTNERTLSGGIGVSRKLKPLEREPIDLPPIDMLYTAAAAEASGASVEIVDLLLERARGNRAEALVTSRAGAPGDAPLWVGVRLSMPSLPRDLAFANRLKGALPRARVFVFGTVIMATLDHWVFECQADFVLFGEPEALIGPMLCAADARAVPGVVEPRAWEPLCGEDLWSGRLSAAREASWVKADHLAKLPRPAWHLLDMPRYAPGGSGDTSRIGVQVQASRGCPIACNMCPYMLLEGKTWRSNDVEAVVDEIEYLNRTWGIYRVRFRDPNFGFSRKYARELAEALIRRGVKLEATVETSVEVLDEATLRAMYAAGIRTLTTGIETSDELCMASIGQKIAVNEKLRERLELCHAIGFHVYGTFCLGAPEETWETVRHTWMFANELDVESGFTVMTPFPGTPMYWRALAEDLIPRRMRFMEWNSYTATMRTARLSLHDLEVARLWARLETILPYRLKRARRAGPASTAMFHLRHVPHYAARLYCRAYAWYRNAAPATSAVSSALPVAGSEGLEGAVSEG